MLALIREPFSTFVPIDGGIEAHEVPLTFPCMSKTTIRILVIGEEASILFLVRTSSKPRKVRPLDFYK